MEYEKGYVYELMDQGGPTNVMEPYFLEAAEEMMRARTLCAKANACLPDDPSYVGYLEELFGRKLDDVHILTPFICDFGNRVKFGKNVFINHSAILSASGGIEFEDGAMAAPGLRIATQVSPSPACFLNSSRRALMVLRLMSHTVINVIAARIITVTIATG